MKYARIQDIVIQVAVPAIIWSKFICFAVSKEKYDDSARGGIYIKKENYILSGFILPCLRN